MSRVAASMILSEVCIVLLLLHMLNPLYNKLYIDNRVGVHHLRKRLFKLLSFRSCVFSFQQIYASISQMSWRHPEINKCSRVRNRRQQFYPCNWTDFIFIELMRLSNSVLHELLSGSSKCCG